MTAAFVHMIAVLFLWASRNDTIKFYAAMFYSNRNGPITEQLVTFEIAIVIYCIIRLSFIFYCCMVLLFLY